MSKEIRDIVNAFREAKKAGRKSALATIVHVEGSSYRMPGARMLVDDNGCLTGAISGGCLEGDARRRALLAIHEGQNKLVTYDTSEDDDYSFGVQLGCNGIVHILFEPIDSRDPDHPVALLERSMLMRRDCVLVTLFSLQNNRDTQPGTCFLLHEKQAVNKISDVKLQDAVTHDANAVFASKATQLREYENGICGFVELIRPPVSLVIVGAGNDAIPLSEMATILGWEVSVVDGRATHASRQRFPLAKTLIVAKPAEVLNSLHVDPQTCFVLMTHNYQYDLELLGRLLEQPVGYMGVLGPKRRLERLLSDLEDSGTTITDERRAAIYGPVGLDIGANPAEEIALSILAEIKAVLAARPAGFLRNRPERIHVSASLH